MALTTDQVLAAVVALRRASRMLSNAAQDFKSLGRDETSSAASLAGLDALKAADKLKKDAGLK